MPRTAHTPVTDETRAAAQAKFGLTDTRAAELVYVDFTASKLNWVVTFTDGVVMTATG